MKKKFIVTGAAGFIGYRLSQELTHKGYDVIGVDHPEHFKSRKEHTENPWIQTIDREKFLHHFENEKHEIHGVYHMGACARTTELDVNFLNRVNVDYSKQVWKICSHRKIPLVYASSAATYGGGEYGHDDDESLISKLKPLNPYGESKRQFDLFVLDQENKKLGHPPHWAGFKFFNVYGFGERHKGSMASVVMHAFDEIKKTGKVKLFESHREGIAHGDQKRDFIFIDDVLGALQFAMNHPIKRGIFNLGSGQARTFLDLAKATFKALKTPENIVFIPTPVELRERYQYFTEAKMDRLYAAGLATPFTSLEDGVSRYVKLLEKAQLSG